MIIRFIIDVFGSSSTIAAFILNIKSILGEHVNVILTTIISILSIIYLAMKVFEKYKSLCRDKGKSKSINYDKHQQPH